LALWRIYAYENTDSYGRNDMKYSIIALCVQLALVPVAWGKRLPPPEVEPSIHEGIRYVAPNDNGRQEYVLAFDIESGKLIMKYILKNTVINDAVEEDTQWSFIKTMEVQGGFLQVTDENDQVFKLKLLKKNKNR